jgi:hypothetical protein
MNLLTTCYVQTISDLLQHFVASLLASSTLLQDDNNLFQTNPQLGTRSCEIFTRVERIWMLSYDLCGCAWSRSTVKMRENRRILPNLHSHAGDCSCIYIKKSTNLPALRKRNPIAMWTAMWLPYVISAECRLCNSRAILRTSRLPLPAITWKTIKRQLFSMSRVCNEKCS